MMDIEKFRNSIYFPHNKFDYSYIAKLSPPPFVSNEVYDINIVIIWSSTLQLYICDETIPV